MRCLFAFKAAFELLVYAAQFFAFALKLAHLLKKFLLGAVGVAHAGVAGRLEGGTAGRAFGSAGVFYF